MCCMYTVIIDDRRRDSDDGGIHTGSEGSAMRAPIQESRRVGNLAGQALLIIGSLCARITTVCMDCDHLVDLNDFVFVESELTAHFHVMYLNKASTNFCYVFKQSLY